jgi:hypothetical protein
MPTLTRRDPGAELATVAPDDSTGDATLDAARSPRYPHFVREPVDTTRRRNLRVLAGVVGALLTVAGVAGFAVTGGGGGDTLLGVGVSPLHNAIHLVVGLAGLAASGRLSATRAYGVVLAVVSGLTVAYGLVATGDPGLTLMGLTSGDGVVHAVATLAGLVMALAPLHRRQCTSANRVPAHDVSPEHQADPSLRN